MFYNEGGKSRNPTQFQTFSPGRLQTLIHQSLILSFENSSVKSFICLVFEKGKRKERMNSLSVKQ